MFEFEEDISLKDFCTFRIGGKAKFLFIAKDINTLIKVCSFAKAHNIKYKTIGLGANLLFDDLGFNGLIIVNKTNKILFRKASTKEASYENSKSINSSYDLTPLTSQPSSEINNLCYNRNDKCHDADFNNCDNSCNNLVISDKTNSCFAFVDSGVNVTSLIMKCYMRSLSGFERLAGIPSTVGGAVVNSLGAFDTNFSDFVEYVECYHKNDLTKKLRLSHDECQFGYRTSLFKSGEYIITKVKLKLNVDNPSMIRKRITEAIEKKKTTQPLDYLSAGSVFKRTNIIPAKAIDELGLKGTKIGGAEISTKHAGFIVNIANATSEDVKQLISLIQQKVKSATNEEIEPEIEFVEY